MKYAVILVSLLASANGYAQTQTETMTTEAKRPSIDNKVEHLDIKQYEKNFTIYYPSSSRPSYKRYIYKEETPYYTITVEGNYTNGFTYRKEFKTVPFNYYIFKRFYPNFSLWNKLIGGRFNNGSKILLGIGYWFNENGQLVKEENYDEGWGFSYEQAVRFAQNKYDEDTFKKMSIIKVKEKGWKYWFVCTEGVYGDGYGEIEELKLDAQTGEIISHVVKYVPRYGAIKVLKVIVPDKTKEKR